ncbi:MAG: hypothetical protein S4CHLAM2_03180 [Chlamydiales bacterium]|nr:hypothetical protein [Chlamydiales bacterium]
MEFDAAILQQLNEIGVALSKEQSIPVLHKQILQKAKDLTHADGGTLYSVVDKKWLRFEIVLSDSFSPIPFPDLPLFLEDGKPNETLMAAYAVHHKKTVQVKDAYQEEGFDFSGTRDFDERTGYRTRAVLTVPMQDHEGKVIAVLQLINPLEEEFLEPAVQLAKSLASQAGLALNKQLLILNLRTLFESFIRVMTDAIDAKSPSTGHHGKRVPIIAELLARALEHPFTEAELYELHIAALLHDCGKITTPDYIVEKKTKLDALFNRIHLIEARFSARIEEEKNQWIQMHYPEVYQELEKAFASKEKTRAEELALIRRCNEGAEPITDKTAEKLARLASLDLLTRDELENLLVVKGNLTAKQIEIMRQHVVMSYRMLSGLPFPTELQAVPEIAASHHERMDGKGYPRGLKGDEMLIQARILAVADVFEALSSPDRSYRKPAPLSKVLKIMQEMADEGHLDPHLVEIFLKKKIYLPYAERYLMPEQLDVD